MRRITTRNSVYEVDEERGFVRRVSGTKGPCRFIGEDGEWRAYHSMIWQPELGASCHYRFLGDATEDNDWSPGFITSTVISEEEI